MELAVKCRELLALIEGNQSPLTLNTLLEKLKVCRRGDSVKFNFGNLVPKGIQSYRGDYALPAIGYGIDIYPYPTVETVIQEIEKALQNSHSGYKGGTYRFLGHEELAVANWGETTNTKIMDIVETDYNTVILLTQEIDS